MQRLHFARLRYVALAAAVLGCTAISGCSYTNPQETTSIAPAVPGVQATVGPVQIADLTIVSTGLTGSGSPGPDAPGRLVGSLFNTSSSSITATVSTQSSNTVDITVPANGQMNLADSPQIVELDHSGAAPGALATLKIEVGGSSETVQVPVLDGTLAQYRQYLPSPTSSGGTPSSSSSGGTPSASGTATSGTATSGTATTSPSSAAATPSASSSSR